MKSILRRWLPAIATTTTHRAALGLAAAALAGAAAVGVTSGTSFAADAPAHVAPAVVAAAPAAPSAPVAPVAARGLGYDFALQPNYYYCGPAATRIALSTRGQLVSFDQLALELGTTTDGTPSAVDIARVLNAHLGANTYVAHSVPGQVATPAEVAQLSADLVAAISADKVVVANVIGTVTDGAGGVHSYDGGHYLTAVGYGANGNTVKIADPADPNGDGSYWMNTVDLANWVASRGYAA